MLRGSFLLFFVSINFKQLTKVTDTSAAQARNGKDIQGIPWDRLNLTRETYRLTRLEQYKNYENIPLSGEAVDKVCYVWIQEYAAITFDANVDLSYLLYCIN